jgi:hypothetical protein
VQVKRGWMILMSHDVLAATTTLQIAQRLQETKMVHVIEPFRRTNICGIGVVRRLELRRMQTRL